MAHLACDRSGDFVVIPQSLDPKIMKFTHKTLFAVQQLRISWLNLGF